MEGQRGNDYILAGQKGMVTSTIGAAVGGRKGFGGGGTSSGAGAGAGAASGKGSGRSGGQAGPSALEAVAAALPSSSSSAGAGAGSSKQQRAEEISSWPPRIDSELRPTILPFSIDKPASAAGVHDDDDDDVVISRKRKGSDKGRKASAGDLAGSGAIARGGIDEASATLEAASLFTHPNAEGRPGLVLEGKLLHVTLPATLPLRAHVPIPGLDVAAGAGAAAASSSSSAAAVSSAASSLPPLPTSDGLTNGSDPSEPYKARMKAIPEGKIGKLRVYASGKVKLEIGGLSFDVSAGLQRQQYEHVVATMPAEDDEGDEVDGEEEGRGEGDDDDLEMDGDGGAGAAAGPAKTVKVKKPAHFAVLGAIAGTAVVTPDLESLINRMEIDQRVQAQRLRTEYEAHFPVPVEHRSRARARSGSAASSARSSAGPASGASSVAGDGDQDMGSGDLDQYMTAGTKIGADADSEYVTAGAGSAGVRVKQEKPRAGRAR